MHKLMPSNFIDSLLKREYKDDTKLKAKIVHDRLRDAQNLYNKDLVSHYGCVNAVEFLNGGQFLVSGGDDQRVLLWNVQEALQGISKPREMRAQHVSNIFCLAHDSKNTRLLSSGNDEQVIIHDIQTAEPVDVFRHHNPVYCLSVDPTNDFVFASACDDGTISIYDIRRPASSGPFLLDKSSFAYHGVHHNPIEPKLLATANTKDGAALWDSRFPNKPLMRYGSGGCMAVRWSCLGRSIVALRRRLPPALYGLYSPLPAAQFNNHNYFNSCTMKSCCFAGLNDQYVLSGSDDFNLYMWDVPAIENRCVAVEPAHLVLFGHRSIVNQVRFCPETNLIASSGVEKIIKIWSPFPLPDCKGGLTRESAIRKRRKVFSHAEYLSLVYRGGQIIDHDYSHESTDEDPRMMAFFDSLVQREIDCWSSEDSDKSHKSEAVKTTAVASNRTLSTEDDRDGRVVLQEEEEEVNDDEEEVVEEQEEVVEEQEEVVEAQEEVVEEQEEVVEEQEEVVEEQQEEEEEDGDETEEGGVRRKRRVQDLEKDSGEDVHSPNPIVKLIARKRSQLIRLAKRKKEDALTSSCSSSKKTSSAGTSNDSSSADSVDADGGNSNKMSGKILKKQRLMRLRKRMLEAFNDSSDENDESAETPSSAHTPGKLRRRTCDDAAASSSAHKSPPAAQAAPATTREGETPDSGIYMLSDEHTNGSFPKNRSNCNRNYRRRILDSDSD